MNIEAMYTKWKELLKHIQQDLWAFDLESLPMLRRLLIGGARMIQLVLRGLRTDDLLVHGSALTFSSLMSLVPILAIALSTLKGLGAGETEIQNLLDWTESMPESFQLFVQQMIDTVNRTNFAALGWISVIILFFMVVQMLGSIEGAFNRIWAITRPRNFLQKCAYYISISVVVPILILAAGTVSATLRSDALVEQLGLLRFAPFFATWAAFSFLYFFMPNTKVSGGPALLSGLIGALLWMLWQKTYINLQFGVARYNAIYGTFASVPIFLAWLYISWVIILLGAEFTFGAQNYSNASLDLHAYRASPRACVMLALSVLTRAAEALESGAPTFELAAYVRTHRIPVRLLHEVVAQISRAGYLAELAENPGAYVLLKTPDQIQVSDIINLLLKEEGKGNEVALHDVEPAIIDLLGLWEEGGHKELQERSIASLIGT